MSGSQVQEVETRTNLWNAESLKGGHGVGILLTSSCEGRSRYSLDNNVSGAADYSPAWQFASLGHSHSCMDDHACAGWWKMRKG
ncbi:hypothetical protein PsorP6_011633 [Peronosclerospora sorghi]|uniref:Uncharacterized protein n=1 Tax=Peronosclerospora sorghi TaxID=230839 RepID=A0ACC0WJ46_9STRA|nr:hypothetical protein PsorP6_011633 [Peronosclerospora sorghi]